MNDFEKKLLADLQAGHSVEEILAEFNKHLTNAQVEANKLEEERRRKAEEEEKRKKAEAAEREKDAKRITELANRALTRQITAEDVSWLWSRYMAQKWGKSDAICRVSMTAEDVDSMVEMASKMFDTIEPLMKATNTTWEKVAKDAEKFVNKTTKSDDAIIKDFLNKIL